MKYVANIRGRRTRELHKIIGMVNKFLPGDKEWVNHLEITRSRNGWHRITVEVTRDKSPWAQTWEPDLGLMRSFKIYETSKHKLPRWLKLEPIN